MSMKNSSDTIGNQIRYLPTFSAVPQPAELPRTPVMTVNMVTLRRNKWSRYVARIRFKISHISLGLPEGKSPLTRRSHRR